MQTGITAACDLGRPRSSASRGPFGSATQTTDERIGEAINESLAESEQIAEVVAASRKAATTFFSSSKPPLE